MKKEKIPIENEDFLTKEEIIMAKPRNSIINIADRAVSVTTLNKLDPKKSFLESLNLSLFKDPVYINIAVGLALCFLSDAAYISLVPSFLMNSGFSFEDRSFFLSMFFASDLAARILVSAMSIFLKIKNRYLFFFGAFFTVIFRTAFTMSDQYYWKLGTVCALGFLRCFIQTPLPVVIAEQYPDTFASAFSLYMVVCGVVSLFFGPIISGVKAWFQSDIMVVHFLTLAYLICVISWLCELLFQRRRRMK